MKIIKKNSFKVIGILVEASWNNLHNEMPKTWEIFKNRLGEIKDPKDQHYMDISLGIEAGIYKQIICVEVKNFDDVPNGMTFKEIPEQQYIYSKHKGQLKNIVESFGNMYKWAEENDYYTDEFKIDYGYTDKGLEEEHSLYIRIPEK